MKIPLSWLRDYIDITLPPAQLIERLTFAGLEVASTRVFGLPIPDGVRVKAEERGPVWDRDKIVVAEVLSVEKHPNADKLKLPTVTWGAGTLKQLVTGAPNINVGDKGQKVVLALSGSILFDGHSDVRKLSELKPTTIRGLPSDAMVCSLLELGVSENKDDHTGIILLEDGAPVGMPLADFMGDIVIEVDVLPNTARCLAMIGVAREVAAITGQRLKLPPLPSAGEGPGVRGEPIAGQVNVQIDDPKLSARYVAALIKNIKLGPAPGWMQRRLLYAGMRPINTIVDITNFVMLEWGQPLHAFDFDVLVQRAGGKAPTIIVRPARVGEVLVTLDKQERKLSPEHLVIADTKGPIALAGVMGGLETEVTEKTTNILLESASFDFVSVRRTFRHFDLPSEASARFSRGIHPETVQPAAERAADLMRQYAGGSVCKGLVDCYPATRPPQVVDFKIAEMDRLLGFKIEPAEAVRILQALEYGVAPPPADAGGSPYKVTVPTHRLDVQEGTADLVEDIVRIYGYDRVPTTLLAEPLPKQQANEPIVFEEKVRDILVDCGLQEVVCYALTMPEKEAPLFSPLPSVGEGPGVKGDRAYVTLKNPISSERVVMRQSVLASVLEIAESNLRHTDDVRLFEVGFAYIPAQRAGSVSDGPSLPAEPRRLAIVMTGNRVQEFWEGGGTKEKHPLDFFELKGVIEAFAQDLHLQDTKYQPSQAVHLHPGKSATLLVGEPSGVSHRVIGDFGVLHPKVAHAYNLGERTILVAEFDVEALQAATPIRFSYRPVPRFPAALRDIAVVVDEAIPAEQIESEIRKAGGDLLGGVRLFDLYRGNQIPAGTKSLAYALSYQAEDRTLADKEIDKAHRKIEDRLKNVLKATIRGKE